jgi:hypothetical protein
MQRQMGALRLALCVAGCLLLLAAPSSVHAADGASCAVPVREAVEFREQFAFSTDHELIRRLNADPDADCEWSVPLTADESAELTRRSQIGSQAQALNRFVDAHEDAFGGIYIDQHAGGQIVLLVAPGGSDRLLADALATLPASVDRRWERVTWSQKALKDFRAEILDRYPYAVFGVNSIGIDVMHNRLEIRINPEHFRRTSTRIIDSYSADLYFLISAGPGRDVGDLPPTDGLARAAVEPLLPGVLLIVVFALGGLVAARRFLSRSLTRR